MKKHRKKAIYLGLLLLLLFSLPGCSKEADKGPEKDITQEPGKDITQEPGKEKEPGKDITREPGKDKDTKPGLAGKIIAEDLQPGNQFVMKTEKGYYYYKYVNQSEQGTSAFHYVDAATGKDIYLCNKPECKHDGNSFCVASNEKYDIGQICLYSDRILATAIEETDTQFLWKLLAIALDGSEMSEVATYLTMDKAALGDGQLPILRGGQLPVHRNKAVIFLGAAGQAYMDDTVQYGTAILDLDTGKVSYLDEEPLSRENSEVTGINAQGDYIYYCKAEGRKTVLHRYCVKDGTDTGFKLQPGFQGMYVVVDEDNIIYMRSMKNILYLYHPSTGESIEAKKMPEMQLQRPTDDGFALPISFDIALLMTDGTYIYAIQQPVDLMFQGEKVPKQRHICVMDHNLEEIAMVNVGAVIPEELNDSALYSSRLGFWSFLGDEIYALLNDDDISIGKLVYRCSRSDLLEGNPEFTFVFRRK